MANFTTAEAEASTLVRCDLVRDDGSVYLHRVCRTSHPDYEDVEWIETGLAEAPAAADVKASIVAYLTSQEAVAKAAPNTFESEALVGSVVSAI